MIIYLNSFICFSEEEVTVDECHTAETFFLMCFLAPHPTRKQRPGPAWGEARETHQGTYNTSVCEINTSSMQCYIIAENLYRNILSDSGPGPWACVTHLTRLTPVCPHWVLYLTDYVKIFGLPLRYEVSWSASFLSGSRDLGFVGFWRLMVSTHVETRAGILHIPGMFTSLLQRSVLLCPRERWQICLPNLCGINRSPAQGFIAML